MISRFHHLKETWELLGKDDPLWAAVSHPDKRGGRWAVEEFLKTGEERVSYYTRVLAAHTKGFGTLCHVLDFGCGVGRLSRAWSSRADKVTGVDVSASMLQRARQLLSDRSNIRLVLNEREDLRCFSDGEFDLVFSLVCLQHMPWPMAGRYIHEFARICRPGGTVAFQLPARRLDSKWWPALRRTVVDSLPFGWGHAYRRWKHGSAAVYDMYYTPFETVHALARAANLVPVHIEPDQSAGPFVESYFHIFEKPTPP